MFKMFFLFFSGKIDGEFIELALFAACVAMGLATVVR
jgi:hypothetical protein